MNFIETIQHDLLSNITVTEMLSDGDVCEWVSDYVEDLMSQFDIDPDEDYDTFNQGCQLVYSHFGAGELDSTTPEWDKLWNDKMIAEQG